MSVFCTVSEICSVKE